MLGWNPRLSIHSSEIIKCSSLSSQPFVFGTYAILTCDVCTERRDSEALDSTHASLNILWVSFLPGVISCSTEVLPVHNTRNEYNYVITSSYHIAIVFTTLPLTRLSIPCRIAGSVTQRSYKTVCAYDNDVLYQHNLIKKNHWIKTFYVYIIL